MRNIAGIARSPLGDFLPEGRETWTRFFVQSAISDVVFRFALLFLGCTNARKID